MLLNSRFLGPIGERMVTELHQKGTVPTLSWSPMQPMETAPKDGTHILAALKYRDENDPTSVLTIRFHEPWRQWVLAGCLIGIQNNAKDDENMDPVGWWPLPTVEVK